MFSEYLSFSILDQVFLFLYYFLKFVDWFLVLEDFSS